MGKRINNLKVYDLTESIIASGYPMKTELEPRAINENDIKRCKALVKASNGNGAHAQFLTGIRVNFDLTFSNKAWVEAERYRFLEFVSSQSTMHRITKFDLDKQYNKYVDSEVINIMNKKVYEYNIFLKSAKIAVNEVNKKKFLDSAKEKYLEILYTNPAGFELTARLATNYRCLLNIYNQRHDHRLPEWREFCEELLELPYFKDFVEAYEGKENE